MSSRYAWICILRDGPPVQRYNEDGSENKPSADCAEFHLLPHPDYNLRPFSLFLKEGQRLIYKIRRHMDGNSNANHLTHAVDEDVFLVGYEEDHGFAHFATYAALLPDGRIEWSSEYNHITRHERNLDVEPLKFYESWGV